MPQDRPTLSQKHPTRSAMRSPQCTESVLRASISCGVGASRGRFLTHVVRPRGRIPTRPRPRARRARPGAGAGHLQEQRSLIVTVARLPRSGIFPGMIPRLAPLASAAAAGYAENGFPVTPIIARDWAAEVARLARDDGARATFLVDGSRAPREGEWFTNPDLARSFRLIAAQGPAALYEGALGRRIVARLGQLGGYLTLDDLREHRPEWVEPMSVPFEGYVVGE